MNVMFLKIISQIRNFDIIVFCEVVDIYLFHQMYPSLFWRQFLNPGGVIVLGTPNAVLACPGFIDTRLS